ncbi:DnaJ domain-containing protein [Sphingomonas hengshuiensis]|uniref:Molecular chaperone DnaJ n=1 Tax=Sphingomonas hengshuiensis TaxID=1609977 RepID=A0A7U4JBQ2_9SPHN|nr:DnaJ domain-containing protein [Sphingomonas hengshuiensis]AJP73879.1 molecular chaperone DnaJ [Sphingomonas hengshuiensis]
MFQFLLAAAVFAAAWIYWGKPRRKPVRQAPPAPPSPPPAEDEARAILGVGADADADAIRAAHRRLVLALHPDKGGSVELTRRINAARDLLLRVRN